MTGLTIEIQASDLHADSLGVEQRLVDGLLLVS